MTTLQTVIAGTGADTRVNENFAQASPSALYAKNPVTSTGLTWGYKGGLYNGNTIADGTVALTASTTNYVVANRSTGTVTASTATTNWNDKAAYLRLYSVVTGTTTVTSSIDYRQAIGSLDADLALDAAVVKLTGNQTVAGEKTFSSVLRAPIYRSDILALGNVTGATNVDILLGDIITATVTGNWTPTFTNQPSSGKAQGVILNITNGGAFTITWPTINWAGLGAPVLAVSGTDMISLLFRGGTAIDGAYVGQLA